MGQLDDTFDHYRMSLDHLLALDDSGGQAHTHLGLALLLKRRGEVAAAI